MSISCLFTMHILHVLYAKLTKFSEKTHGFQVLFFIQWQKYRIRFLSVHTKRFYLTKDISVKRKRNGLFIGLGLSLIGLIYI